MEEQTVPPTEPTWHTLCLAASKQEGEVFRKFFSSFKRNVSLTLVSENNSMYKVKVMCLHTEKLALSIVAGSIRSAISAMAINNEFPEAE